MSTQQNTRGVRGNGNFRIATCEIKKHESPEKHLPSSSSACDFRGKARFNTLTRASLYHAPCNNDDRDNNISDGDGDNDDVVFYKRYEHDREEVEGDDENNREFDSPKDLSGSSSTCVSGATEALRCSSLHCALPRLFSVERSLDRSWRTFNDMRLKSIEGLLVAQNQLQDCEENPEDGSHDDLLGDPAVEQPQQDADEGKGANGEVRINFDKSDASSETRVSNQFSIELIETTTHSAKCYEGESPLLRRRRSSSSICCEPMVQYELFDSVRKSQQQLMVKSSESNYFFSSHRNHEDDDVMNIRSPVNQKTSSGSSSSISGELQQQQQHEHLIGWTPQQLNQYNEVLTFLQDACATRSAQISIPGARLAQMEQLLRSLHPKA